MLKMTMLVTATTLAFAAVQPADAQSWLYQSGPGGTPPLMYSSPTWQGGVPVYQPPSNCCAVSDFGTRGFWNQRGVRAPAAVDNDD